MNREMGWEPAERASYRFLLDRYARVSERQMKSVYEMAAPCSGIQMIEHEIDHDASDRNVKPERESPTRDAAVGGETGFQRAIQGDEHKRNDGGGENGMRD